MKHWKVNVVVPLIASVSPLPESVPEFVHGPPAVQLVAPLEPQEMVDLLPATAGFGEIESDDVGVPVAGGAQVTEPLPISGFVPPAVSIA